MRITTDELTTEKARDIYEWLMEPRAQLFFDQLQAQERYIMDKIIREPESAFIFVEQIKALRAVSKYHIYIQQFLSERVTGNEDSKIIVDTKIME